MAPEIFSNQEYSKSTDVYAFAFIVYEIVTCEFPFKNFAFLQIMNKVVNEGFRPKIKGNVPDAYRNLIESCWSQDPDKRPSFDNIVKDLESNEEFITELIDKIEFEDYVDYIKKYKSTFDKNKKRVNFEEFIKVYGRKKIIKKFSKNVINDSDEESIKTSTVKNKYTSISIDTTLIKNEEEEIENITASLISTNTHKIDEEKSTTIIENLQEINEEESTSTIDNLNKIDEDESTPTIENLQKIIEDESTINIEISQTINKNESTLNSNSKLNKNI